MSTTPHDGATPRRINVELLDRIEQQITEHPETWDQNAWFILPPGTYVRDLAVDLNDEGYPIESPFDPPCGTAEAAADPGLGTHRLWEGHLFGIRVRVAGLEPVGGAL